VAPARSRQTAIRHQRAVRPTSERGQRTLEAPLEAPCLRMVRMRHARSGAHGLQRAHAGRMRGSCGARAGLMRGSCSDALVESPMTVSRDLAMRAESSDALRPCVAVCACRGCACLPTECPRSRLELSLAAPSSPSPCSALSWRLETRLEEAFAQEAAGHPPRGAPPENRHPREDDDSQAS
jgi:hypothetical protein